MPRIPVHGIRDQTFGHRADRRGASYPPAQLSARAAIETTLLVWASIVERG
jgi:hypothetical protein